MGTWSDDVSYTGTCQSVAHIEMGQRVVKVAISVYILGRNVGSWKGWNEATKISMLIENGHLYGLSILEPKNSLAGNDYFCAVPPGGLYPGGFKVGRARDGMGLFKHRLGSREASSTFSEFSGNCSSRSVVTCN